MKILIVRFSSFGDIVQALPCVKSIRQAHPTAEIHWLTRLDFAELVEGHPNISKVLTLDRRTGIAGFLRVVRQVRAGEYTHIYDAHNNLRSFFLRAFVRMAWRKPKILVRSKNRWKRFLYFKLRRPVFTMPFRGALSFIEPLTSWGVTKKLIPPPHLYLPITTMDLPDSFIAIAPSAAWETKRWPLDSWKRLIELLPSSQFVVLGGPQDTFCEELAAMAPLRVKNLAGRSSLIESCYVVKRSLLTISGDTGILHAADQMGVRNIGLIGPTAFGYTSHSQSVILETQLYCKPCSKDGSTPCVNPIFQKCMKEILPENVAQVTTALTGVAR